MLRHVSSFIQPYTRTLFFQRSPHVLSTRHMSLERRKIRMSILSDTHGSDLNGVSFPKADVVLHCGDLTRDSRCEEFETTLAMLRAIDAPLKLTIPGNHDFSLELDYWKWTQSRCHPAQQQRQQQRNQGSEHVPAQGGQVEQTASHDVKATWEILRCAALRDRIYLLPQGTHTFVLPVPQNIKGVRLRIFASPLTPRLGNWGFQYDRSNPHRWVIPSMMSNEAESVDVVMTHGPPRGIRDGTGKVGPEGAMSGTGCAGLLAALERARPRVHCFGHIHGAWGAELVTWKRKMEALDTGWASSPILSNLVDARQSRVLASLPLVSPTEPGGHEGRIDRETVTAARVMLPHPSHSRKAAGYFALDISRDGMYTVDRGSRILFVNAAVELPRRTPWLIDIDLPVADEDDAAAATQTMSRLI